MIAKLESQKWHSRAVDFGLRWSMSKISSAKKLHLFLSDINHCGGFLFCMNAEASEEARKPDHLEPGLLCPQHEVPVQRKTKGFVDWSYPIPYVAAPEHCLLRNVSNVKESIGVVRRKDCPPNFRSVRVDKYSMSVHDIDVWPRLKNMCNIGQRARKQRVVAVQIGHDVAIDGGSLEAGIDSVGLAAVRFATPGDLLTIRIQEIDGSVLRGAVLNMIRKGRVILPQNARDRCFQIFALVVARRYDCDPRWGIGQRRQFSSRIEPEGLRGMLLKRPHRRLRQKSPQLLDYSGSEEGCYHSDNFLLSGGDQSKERTVGFASEGLAEGDRFRRSPFWMM